MHQNNATDDIRDSVRRCTLCAERFAATATRHAPRPVVWFRQNPPILIASQAPGLRVHEAGKAFWDRSGDRLRAWMGVDRDLFYDDQIVSVLPTAFCFPGYDHKGADLPPPRICWDTWHSRCLDQIGRPKLRLIVGKHAIERHLGEKGPLRDVVRNWRAYGPDTFVLPHPSWRNNTWLAKHPWFEQDLVPSLQRAVARVVTQHRGPDHVPVTRR